MSGIIMALLLTTSSCQTEVISPTELKLERYAATTTDFPKDWAFVGEAFSNELGNGSYSANYGVPNNNNVSFGETIVIHSDQIRAQKAYLEWEKKWFSVTKKWAGTEFNPLVPNDEYRYECLQIFSDIVSCRFLQKHNELVVLILVNVDDKAMTLGQFNGVLRALDERLNKVKLN
jgi:hypothetical protein